MSPDPETLRQLAAVNRSIAQTAWTAYYGHARYMNPTEAELQLLIANSATKLAYTLERKALALEGRSVET